jgi:predicted nucleic acid-binding protein
MKETRYLLDANVFIEAARRYYAFDLVPTFWDVLIDLASNGRVASIDRVKDELLPSKEEQKDELAKWIEKHFSEAFASTNDGDVIRRYGKVMNWVKNQTQYNQAAKQEFARVADGWLVAYAMSKGHTLVTHEVPSQGSKKRVAIPDVCQAFNLNYLDTFRMLRDLGVRL